MSTKSGLVNSAQPVKKRTRGQRIGVGSAIAIIVLIAYLISVFLYSQSGQSEVESQPAEVANGVNLSVDLVAMDPARSQMVLRFMAIPAGSFAVSPEDPTLTRPLRISVIAQTSGSNTRDLPAGLPPGAIESTVYIEGNPEYYPFDRYSYSVDEQAGIPGITSVTPAPLIRVESLDAKGKVTKELVPIGYLGPSDGAQGWAEEWNFVAEADYLYLDLTVKRAGGVLAFVLVILILIIVVAVLALLVAAVVWGQRRRIEATMSSWLAALLFALIPLRINLPGAPPIGSWMDITVFFWVELALLVAMSGFITAWLTYSKAPEVSSGKSLWAIFDKSNADESVEPESVDSRQSEK